VQEGDVMQSIWRLARKSRQLECAAVAIQAGRPRSRLGAAIPQGVMWCLSFEIRISFSISWRKFLEHPTPRGVLRNSWLDGK